ncbi:MAG: hypothetical protein DI607_07190 [Sphingomonas hengshuiensis]|nr:MAG: hypothetical protein DI607_07190 [Sphingomonas hengshuiensis]
MSATETVVDIDRIGRKGFPRHYQAFGAAPPTKVVPVDAPAGAPGLPLEEQMRLEIQAVLDAKARERGYDSLASAVSYVTSTVPAWAAEALVLRDWRDAVWSYALAELAAVQAGTREAPSVATFLAEIRAACPFAWPE